MIKATGSLEALVTTYQTTHSVTYQKISFTHSREKLDKTKGNIIFLYIKIFKFLNSRREDKRFWTEW
jgi:hypothetical protein